MSHDITDDVLRIVNALRVDLADLVLPTAERERQAGMRQADALDAAVIALVSVAVNIAEANSLKGAADPNTALHVLVDTLFDGMIR